MLWAVASMAVLVGCAGVTPGTDDQARSGAPTSSVSSMPSGATADLVGIREDRSSHV